MPKIIKIVEIEVDKPFVPQKWRPGRWNWKVFRIFEPKLVLGSAIFIRIGAVTILEIGVKFQCFFDLLLHSGQSCWEKFSVFNLSHSAYLIAIGIFEVFYSNMAIFIPIYKHGLYEVFTSWIFLWNWHCELCASNEKCAKI